MYKNLWGKVALVTGGAKGLGKCVCQVLAQHKMAVIVADIDYEGALATASSIGDGASAIHLDVLDPASVTAVVAGVLSRDGRIDVLVSNAGVNQTTTMDDMTIEVWDRIINTNLRGAFLMSSAVWPFMKAQGSGHIIYTCSTASRRIISNAAAYNASKAGLAALSLSQHVEGRPLGIKVTTLNPGGMRTDLVRERLPTEIFDTLQDPANIARVFPLLLSMPVETIIPEMTITSATELSWP